MTTENRMRIGPTSGSLLGFDELTPVMDDPRPDPMQYARTIDPGSGPRKFLGHLNQNLHWDRLTEAQRNAIYAMIGNVQVETVDNSGAFGLYTATLEWPEEEPEHYAGRVLDLNVMLKDLEGV
jgi:hypothetical protein